MSKLGLNTLLLCRMNTKNILKRLDPTFNKELIINPKDTTS